MPQNKFGTYVQLAVAAVRAAYGDFSGVAVQALKHLPQIIAILVALTIILIILPVLFIQSLFTGDSGSLSGTFKELAIEALQYKEDWITILAVAQTKKVLTGSSNADLEGAAQAVKNDTIETYLKTDADSDDIMDIYRRNRELLQSLLCNYAGYEYFYDEIPCPSSYEAIRKKYSEVYKYNILEEEYPTDDGTSARIIYSSNDVVSYKIEDGLVKIKYRKYTLKVYFPIPMEYSESFTDDFGSLRNNDGQNQGHEGNDIFTARNTPVISIEDCTIKKIGWDGLGGWRVLLESMDGLREYYYAHMENYADGLQRYKDISGKVYDYPGIEVKAGEIIGYVGSSGSFDSSTPPGADTGTPPHLHFQLWVVDKGWFSQKETLLDPYYCLKLLENSKYSEALKENKEEPQRQGL
jgi:murein DD-endopeptidase MepM/ murein hydrolase activator NlpD